MKYVKLADDPQFWFVDEKGERSPIKSVAEMYAIGLHPVETVSPEELERIPVAGEKKTKTKASGEKPAEEPETDDA